MPARSHLEPTATAGVFTVSTGTAELVPDKYVTNGWILLINGMPSSHIDLNNPSNLEFEYMRWAAAIIETNWDSQTSLRTLHLGGAACTFARYLLTVFPNSKHVAVEIDEQLANYVRDWFALPRAPRLKIRVGEARAVLESLVDNSRDLIFRDVFSGSTTPQSVTTQEFTTQARRVLAPEGIYLVNCGDRPDLTLTRREAATIGSIFKYTAVVADPAMLKGRRRGNVIIAGSDRPLTESASLPKILLSGAVPAQVWDDAQVRKFCETSTPLSDAH